MNLREQRGKIDGFTSGGAADKLQGEWSSGPGFEWLAAMWADRMQVGFAGEIGRAEIGSAGALMVENAITVWGEFLMDAAAVRADEFWNEG